MSFSDINVDRRTDGQMENRTPISHPSTSRCDKKESIFVIYGNRSSTTVVRFALCNKIDTVAVSTINKPGNMGKRETG